MSVYIDVWHRTHPLTREAHTGFLNYYGELVVAPPSDYFEVVGGFRYVDGPSNEDFALYRYESMAKIEESMMSFGADEAFISATEALFREIKIEETRAIGIHPPHFEEARLDALIAESASRSGRYLRTVRTSGSAVHPQDFVLLGELRNQFEKAGTARLAAAFQYLVGPVMDIVEIWQLPDGKSDLPRDSVGVDSALQEELDRRIPERERRGLIPTDFSKLR